MLRRGSTQRKSNRMCVAESIISSILVKKSTSEAKAGTNSTNSGVVLQTVQCEYQCLDEVAASPRRRVYAESGLWLGSDFARSALKKWVGE